MIVRWEKEVIARSGVSTTNYQLRLNVFDIMQIYQTPSCVRYWIFLYTSPSPHVTYTVIFATYICTLVSAIVVWKISIRRHNTTRRSCWISRNARQTSAKLYLSHKLSGDSHVTFQTIHAYIIATRNCYLHRPKRWDTLLF